MSIKMETTVIYRGPMDQKVKGLPGAVKKSLKGCVQLWHREYLPKHFDTLGAVQSRYPGVYKARTRKYMIRKAKIHKHQRLLDWSGVTRVQMIRRITVSGTSKGVKGRMTGSNRALNFSGRSDMPNMREEITTINQAESDTLAAVFGQDIENFMNSVQQTRVIHPDGTVSEEGADGTITETAADGTVTKREIKTGRRGGRYWTGGNGRRNYLRR